MSRPTHLDLCSGIGGFSLAAEWAGYQTIGFCEIEPWPRKVLAKNFPGVPMHDDIKTLEADRVRQWIADAQPLLRNDRGLAVDATLMQRASEQRRQSNRNADDGGTLGLVTGGYPCQPFSLAGKRLGTEDDRHLWPFIAALVADLKPQRCLFENVYGHVSMGLDAVLADLAALGYACGAVVVPAAAVGAPHRRDRVWILADADGQRGSTRMSGSFTRQEGESRITDDGDSQGGRDASDAAARGIRRGRASGDERQPAFSGEGGDAGEVERGLGEPPDGLSRWMVGPDRLNPWAGDWEDGCPRTQATETDRVNKLKALGNAIVPQVAYAILSAWEIPA